MKNKYSHPIILRDLQKRYLVNVFNEESSKRETILSVGREKKKWAIDLFCDLSAPDKR